jgi:hypothetical protein
MYTLRVVVVVNVEATAQPKFELLSKVDMLFCYLSLLFLKNTSFIKANYFELFFANI